MESLSHPVYYSSVYHRRLSQDRSPVQMILAPPSTFRSIQPIRPKSFTLIDSTLDHAGCQDWLSGPGVL
ncbi:hypothetical protein AC579_3286 [Pseudocercospora musae]|uniref:Uncharacterized protein n=1 Tax=Pseudocercospora musae TaxID=113226 RepID=A0A139ID52_9PEZI|nr:hypothetical protein AC579_3286 [Pseudocercospora musae]